MVCVVGNAEVIPTLHSEPEMWDLEETATLLEAIEREARGTNDNDDQITFDPPEFWSEVQWENVAEQVGGGRSARDCLLHFLRLPIEEIFAVSEVEGGSYVTARTRESVYGSQEPPSAAKAEEAPHQKNSETDGLIEQEDVQPREQQANQNPPALEPVPSLSVFMATPNPVMALLSFLQQTLHVEVAASAAQAAMRVLSTVYEQKGNSSPGEGEGELSEADIAMAMSHALSAAAGKSHALAIVRLI